jgi:hypothetical protein
MSETITLSSGEQETIHGTFADAKSYIAMMYGESYDTWRTLATDDKKKQTLASAVRYLNAQVWIDSADTFAERDAIAEFATAQYELAVLIANDPSVTAVLDAGTNIRSVSASGASVEYFAPLKPGAGATKLPMIVHRLIGKYLAASQGAMSVVGYSSTGGDSSEFDDCSMYRRGGSF